MHVMGKVAVWLVVLAAAASTILTAKLIQVRNSWTKKATDYQTQYEKLQPKIAEQTEQVARLQADYFRARDLWGVYWKDVPTQIRQPAQGILVIDIGMNHGVRPKDYLYGFEVMPDGTSVYRGDFTVDVAQDVQSQLVPNWVVRPDDVETWQQGNWRWRNMIPPGNQPVFDRLTQAIAREYDALADRQARLKAETELEMQAIAQLKQREAELIGGDQLSKDPESSIEYREGLVAAVEETEETRNQVLRKVDELRRRLRSVQHDVDERQAQNLELTRKLPQPPTAVGANSGL